MYLRVGFSINRSGNRTVLMLASTLPEWEIEQKVLSIYTIHCSEKVSGIIVKVSTLLRDHRRPGLAEKLLCLHLSKKAWNNR